jgi:hypothetical protein
MGQMEMECIFDIGKKIFLFWPRLLRWAMWPMGLLFYCLLSSVHMSGCPSVCLSVCKLYIFNFFSRTTLRILSRLGTNHSWGEGIQFFFFQMKGIALLQGGDNSKRVKIDWKFLKSFSAEPAGQSQSNLVQIIHGLREFKFVQIEGQVLFKVEIITKSKNEVGSVKNLLKNYEARKA